MPQSKIYEIIDRVFDAFIISVVASFVRLMFYREDSFWQTIANFFGGVAFGMLVGYLFRFNTWPEYYREILIAAAALLGKEVTGGLMKLVPVLIKYIPEYLKLIINHKSK